MTHTTLSQALLAASELQGTVGAATPAELRELSGNARDLEAVMAALEAVLPFVCAGSADHEVAVARKALLKVKGGAL